MDRGAWRATVHRVAEGWKQLKQLSMHIPEAGSPKSKCQQGWFIWKALSWTDRWQSSSVSAHHLLSVSMSLSGLLVRTSVVLA